MTTTAPYTIRYGDWAMLGQLASGIRTQVFVHEQGVPAELEMDTMDAVCLHALACDGDGKPVGTARLLPDGHIGRMAVHRQERGAGIGSALLLGLMSQARARGESAVVLSAQTHAAGFYTRHGFVVEGDEFFAAGIAHVQMKYVF